MVNEEISKKYFETYCKPINMALIVSAKANVDYYEKKFNYNDDASLTLEKLEGLDPKLADFYLGVSSWYGKWRTREHLEFSLEGSFNILSFEKSREIGDSTFLPDENPVMRGFHLLDYFYNEGAVGFYWGQPERGLFLFKFDGETEPLMVDFEGYLKLLVYTKGVGYWQNLIVTHLTKIVQGNVLKIREHMPKLFPEFSHEGFIELYESVRLR